MSKTLKLVAPCRLSTGWDEFTMRGFEEEGGQGHVALMVGDVPDGLPVLSCIHPECLTGDALFSVKCNCGPQLQVTVQAVQKGGRGIIVYLRQEGRGIGLMNKTCAYRLQDQGLDTVEANAVLGLLVDARDFALAEQIYDYPHIRGVRSLTNNPEKIQTLKDFGINVVERIALYVGENVESERYLHTRADKLGYLIFD